MMKRVILILLIGIYALATMGFSINHFYCCGKLTSVSISLTDTIKSSCNKSGCCKNKFQYVKVKDNHVSADEISAPFKSFTHLPLFTCYQDIAIVSRIFTIANRSNAPPVFPVVPSYIMNCVFRV